MPGGWEWLTVAGVLLSLFGAQRHLGMVRFLGQSARVFRSAMKGPEEESDKAARIPVESAIELPQSTTSGGTATPATQPPRSNGVR
jgi:sec-independent protein translocase protein TatA